MIFKQRGQILGEVLIAIAVFSLVIFSASLLIFDSFTATRQGLERTKATLLAKEGLEAARSIRDNDFGSLENDDHGIELSGGNWTFSGSSDEVDKYTRVISIQDEQEDDQRKKVISQVEWSINSAREEKIELATYLADYEVDEDEIDTCSGYCESEDYDDGTCRQNANQCNQNDETYEEDGDQYCTGPAENVCCCQGTEEAGSFYEVIITSSNSPVTEGETLTVNADITNTGDADGSSQEIVLEIDGQERDSTWVELNSGETTSETLSWNTSSGDAEDYTATVSSEDNSDSVEVAVEGEGFSTCSGYCQSLEGYSDGGCTPHPFVCWFWGGVGETGEDDYCSEGSEPTCCCF